MPSFSFLGALQRVLGLLSAAQVWTRHRCAQVGRGTGVSRVSTRVLQHWLLCGDPQLAGTGRQTPGRGSPELPTPAPLSLPSSPAGLGAWEAELE